MQRPMTSDNTTVDVKDLILTVLSPYSTRKSQRIGVVIYSYLPGLRMCEFNPGVDVCYIPKKLLRQIAHSRSIVDVNRWLFGAVEYACFTAVETLYEEGVILQPDILKVYLSTRIQELDRLIDALDEMETYDDIVAAGETGLIYRQITAIGKWLEITQRVSPVNHEILVQVVADCILEFEWTDLTSVHFEEHVLLPMLAHVKSQALLTRATKRGQIGLIIHLCKELDEYKSEEVLDFVYESYTIYQQHVLINTQHPQVNISVPKEHQRQWASLFAYLRTTFPTFSSNLQQQS